MKRVLLLALSLVLSLIISVVLLVGVVACSIQTRQDQVLDSLGKYEEKQLWTHGGFQDYADFGKYAYRSVSMEQNSYFEEVSSADIGTIHGFLDNFEGWIETFRKNDPCDALVINYNFDRALIDTGDYFYIYEDVDYSQYSCYDVWFFDSQSNVLYYFHNNI